MAIDAARQSAGTSRGTSRDSTARRPTLPARAVRELALPEGGPPLRLEGIVSSATQPVAIINGRLISPGETVLGFLVLRIGDDEVELRRDGRTTVVALR